MSRDTLSLVYHDSGSQNVRILKHDKHSEITIRATLALSHSFCRQTGEFLTLHDPWVNLGQTRAFSCLLIQFLSRKWTRASLVRINFSAESFGSNRREDIREHFAFLQKLKTVPISVAINCLIARIAYPRLFLQHKFWNMDLRNVNTGYCRAKIVLQ